MSSDPVQKTLVNLRTIDKYLPLFDPSHPKYRARYKVFRGGRGGRKSWEVARGLLVRGLREDHLILCTREFQNSIADSVMAVLEQQAVLIGLRDYYRFTKTNIYSRTNDTKFIFKGLGKNIQSIRSTEGITIAWNEEAQKTSRKSLKDFIPTIRKPGAEVWTSYNPDQDEDPIHKWANSLDPAISYVCDVNYTDNPDIDPEFVADAIRMRDQDYDEYAHVYLGQTWRRSDAQIFNKKWRVGGFAFTRDQGNVWRLDGKEEASGPYFGLDFGFASDPTFLVRCFITGTPGKKGSRLWIDHEYSKVKLETVDMPDRVRGVQEAATHTIRADSARPETISHLKNNGLNVIPAEKWKGSVEDGIAYLRSFDEIIIHERCLEMVNEAKFYSYKTDKLTGDVLPDIVDANNHGWDAVRYALQPLIKQGDVGGVMFL